MIMIPIQGHHILSSIKLHADDIIVLALLTPFLYSLVQFFYLPPKREPGYELFFVSPQEADGLMKGGPSQRAITRDLGEVFARSGLDAAVLWGSQSGMSETLARAFARRCSQSTGLKLTTDDAANYEPDSLVSVPENKVVVFVVATYGEGDPPDGAVELDNYLKRLSQERFARGVKLQNLRYLIFGLGNTKYQHYNRFARDLDERLGWAGAKRLGYAGFRDEALRLNRTWDEWTDDAVRVLAEKFKKSVEKSMYVVPATLFDIVDSPAKRSQDVTGMAIQPPRQDTRIRTQWSSVPIVESRILSKTANGSDSERRAGKTYLHVEFDLSSMETAATYQVGDHVAVLPQNHDHEVLRLVKLFGWDTEKARNPVEMVLGRGRGQENMDVDLIPDPTTRDAILRSHLDICGAPSQEAMRLISMFAPTAAAKELILSLLDDQEWIKQVVAQHRTLGELMELATADTPEAWPDSLFPHLIQTLPRLRPRYFSISSSPCVDPRRLSVTAGILKAAVPGGRTFFGLATNHLLHLHKSMGAVEGGTRAGSCGPRLGARELFHKTTIHIRVSDFKPPSDPSCPVILVAAGSGIAPFRGFIHDRRMLRSRGVIPGRTILFYGCRSKDTDLLYGEEWQRAGREIVLEVDVAESRGCGGKVYVQDRIRARIGEVLQLLREEGAGLYICGSVDMAQGVKEAIREGCEELGDTKVEAQGFLAQIKASKRLQEDVWT